MGDAPGAVWEWQLCAAGGYVKGAERGDPERG